MTKMTVLRCWMNFSPLALSYLLLKTAEAITILIKSNKKHYATPISLRWQEASMKVEDLIVIAISWIVNMP